MTTEAVMLTGGQSRRMGQDKAKLAIGGVAQAARIVRQLADAGIRVTVLGQEPIEGAEFQRDQAEFAGPIAALSAFVPRAAYVFVTSCDLPLFNVRLVACLQERIGSADACAPEVDGFRQPLCALYSANAFDKLAALEDQCAMGWLNALNTVIVPESELIQAGIKPAAARGANTPEELAQALQEANG